MWIDYLNVAVSVAGGIGVFVYTGRSQKNRLIIASR